MYLRAPCGRWLLCVGIQTPTMFLMVTLWTRLSSLMTQPSPSFLEELLPRAPGALSEDKKAFGGTSRWSQMRGRYRLGVGEGSRMKSAGRPLIVGCRHRALHAKGSADSQHVRYLPARMVDDGAFERRRRPRGSRGGPQLTVFQIVDMLAGCH